MGQSYARTICERIQIAKEIAKNDVQFHFIQFKDGNIDVVDLDDNYQMCQEYYESTGKNSKNRIVLNSPIAVSTNTYDYQVRMQVWSDRVTWIVDDGTEIETYFTEDELSEMAGPVNLIDAMNGVQSHD
jgi:hypothetical protein